MVFIAVVLVGALCYNNLDPWLSDKFSTSFLSSATDDPAWIKDCLQYLYRQLETRGFFLHQGSRGRRMGPCRYYAAGHHPFGVSRYHRSLRRWPTTSQR